MYKETLLCGSKEIVERKETYFKYLRLITPEAAQGLGIPSESPVFVSPIVSGRSPCKECGESFDPIVYQTRYLVKGHGFHSKVGGIYYLKVPTDRFYETIWFTRWWTRRYGEDFTGWLALLEPNSFSKKIENPFSALMRRWLNAPQPLRSPEVYVSGIKGFCVRGEDHLDLEIRTGVLFSFYNRDQLLYPLCDQHALEVNSALIKKRFSFTIEKNGEIFFSLPSVP